MTSAHLQFFLRDYSDALSFGEPGLNCEVCSMSCFPHDSPQFRQANLKCCTFWPMVPNFLAGAWLNEHGPSILTSAIATPLGLEPPLEYQENYFRSGANGQGRNAALLCPWFDKRNNKCGVWSSRPGECLTYFCQSENREGFWLELNRLANFIEQGIAQLALLAKGFTWPEIQDNQWPQDFSDRNQFYLDCWRWVTCNQIDIDRELRSESRYKEICHSISATKNWSNASKLSKHGRIATRP